MTLRQIKSRLLPRKNKRAQFRKIFSDALHKRHPFARTVLKNFLLTAIFGDKNKSRYYFVVEKTLAEPCPLFHLSYASLVPEIRENGLRGKDFVFLTDSIRYAPEYYQWKDGERADGEDRYVLIAVNTDKLMAEGHVVCKLVKKHKFVTDAVPPSCISDVVALTGKKEE